MERIISEQQTDIECDILQNELDEYEPIDYDDIDYSEYYDKDVFGIFFEPAN